MVSIRHFNENDIGAIQANQYPDMSSVDIRKMINEWSTCSFQGKYFEMFAILVGEQVVGTSSLYEHSKNVASIGIETFEEYQRSGYAFEAMLIMMNYAKERGYKVIQDQIHTDNIASIRLHEKVEFETDGYIYKNRKNQGIFLYLKVL